MSTEAFEKRLQCQPMRQMPGEWRAGILAATKQASLPDHASRITSTLRSAATEDGHHASPSPSLLSTLNSQLSTILWPHPAAWAGLAAVWLVILGINLTTRDASQAVARNAAPLSPQVFMAFQEQERLLSELIGPRDTPVAERPKPRLPRPRSEGHKTLLMAQSGQTAAESRGNAPAVALAAWDQLQLCRA